jgi:hypothetical protein
MNCLPGLEPDLDARTGELKGSLAGGSERTMTETVQSLVIKKEMDSHHAD